MTTRSRPSVLIIGGGASGVLLAAHLMRDPNANIRVTIVEKRGEVGRGLAYSAQLNEHLLNVAVSGMSAFADVRDHFWRWLKGRQLVPDDDPFVFVPRHFYGTYLADIIKQAAESGRLSIVLEEAEAMVETAAGVEVKLGNGASIIGHLAVLAVGHEERPANARGVAIRVGSLQDTPIPSAAPVMILGSGLSMVDAWLMLAARQHTGPILVVSRHGLLPMAHRRAEPISIDAADVPFGTSLPYFTRWFRKLVGDVVGAGGDWRSVVDGLRPFNQRIWQNWTPHSRQQFLRHLRPWWNIHRHRLPPQMHARLQEAVARGKVQLLAAEFLRADAIEAEGIVDSHASARIRLRGKRGSKDVAVARVYDCGGVSVDVDASSNPLIQSLVGNGQARPDPLHIGLDVTPDCALIDASGRPSRRVLVVGPLTRSAFFEIEAIPDIRLQCAALATRILNGHLPTAS